MGIHSDRYNAVKSNSKGVTCKLHRYVKCLFTVEKLRLRVKYCAQVSLRGHRRALSPCLLILSPRSFPWHHSGTTGGRLQTC